MITDRIRIRSAFYEIEQGRAGPCLKKQGFKMGWTHKAQFGPTRPIYYIFFYYQKLIMKQKKN